MSLGTLKMVTCLHLFFDMVLSLKIRLESGRDKSVWGYSIFTPWKLLTGT